MNLLKLAAACVLASPLMFSSSVIAQNDSKPVCTEQDSGTARCHSDVIVNNDSKPGSNAPGKAKKFRRVCTDALPDEASCHSDVVADDGGTPLVTSAPTGYGPAQFHNAYGLPAKTATTPPIIAIVDAYDSPTIENDLNVYSKNYGLPPCTTANGCFKKVNQFGKQSAYPSTNYSWALEIALDVEIAHAICQNCKILLVEAKSSSFSDLLMALDTAVNLGAKVISNSYGGSEFSSETSASYDGHFNHPGVAIIASSGDQGYGVNYPAASQYVTAVGGTTLTLDPTNNTRQSEATWSGSGSGCSAYEPKPSWQNDLGCAHRTVADISADADPNTGASVYNTTASQPGWFQVGGTSLAAPLIAGVYALAGNTNSTTYGSYPYTHTASIYDVLSGSNSSSCTSYLCMAGSNYDGPTGLGTPNGTGGF